MPSKISEITSSLLARAENQQTGRSTGSAGVGQVLTNPNSVDTARAWLASKNPQDVDKALAASLQSQLGVSLNVNKEWRFPEAGPAYQVATTTGLTGLSTENHGQALAKIEAAFTPVLREQAETMVSQLHAVLARRGSNADEDEIAFDVYVHVLMQHPADISSAVVRHLCTAPRKDGKTAWFPTPPEIEAMCQNMVTGRLSLRTALRSWRPMTEGQKQEKALYEAYRAKNAIASELETKTGPGPATDTGPRGERIAAANAAREEAQKAKQEWVAFKKTID